MPKITVRTVEALLPGEIAWDTELKGFGCRYRSENRHYVLKARVDGRQRWITIGRHGSPWTPETARREARRLLGQIAEGHDPAGSRDDAKAVVTVDDALDRFIAEHVNSKLRRTTAANYGKTIKTVLRPALGKIKLDSVKRSRPRCGGHSLSGASPALRG